MESNLGATVVGLVAGYLVLAWVARRVALDMRRQGRRGWIYGLLVLLLPLLGLAVWLAMRDWRFAARGGRPAAGTLRGDGGDADTRGGSGARTG